ncbi:hypothetical protein ACVDG5_024720 [Mesorhizobium sp. ORM6]
MTKVKATNSGGLYGRAVAGPKVRVQAREDILATDTAAAKPMLRPAGAF